MKRTLPGSSNGLLAMGLCFFIVGCGGFNLTKEDQLVAAARNDDVTALAKLLANGANIDGREKGMLRQTPLVACASIDGTNAFYFLLTKGANVNTPANEGITPLMEAVSLGDANLPRVKELIRRGANVNAPDLQGNSVLAHARAAACQLITHELITAGAKD